MLQRLYHSVHTYAHQNAFCINEVFYTYTQFTDCVSGIRSIVRNNIPKTEKIIGLMAYDDLETYASIIALWFEGKAYVPINPETPRDRNLTIIQQAGIKTILTSNQADYPEIVFLCSSQKIENKIDHSPVSIIDDEIAYILFTSGSTGMPKGVPICFSNIEGFVQGFEALGYKISSKDKCLQMFELTFDLSVMSYLIPLLNGACIYTIPPTEIKYSYIAELMDTHQLTVALMVPSILHYLRPYFGEIKCFSMRYSLFCGEALPLDITQEWSQCVPKARIDNVYGPTEDTIFCTAYTFKREEANKVLNGILSIGCVMKGTHTIIVDDNNRSVHRGDTGELCLSGIQLTPGYWKNEQKNKESFFYQDGNRYYKTGDLCSTDEEGDLMYHGRLDFQAKIQGFRVELTEIEYHARELLKDKINIVALAFVNSIGNTEIGLVFESLPFGTQEFIHLLKEKLPAYMHPTQLRFVEHFPLNINGKIDRKKLTILFTE